MEGTAAKEALAAREARLAGIARESRIAALNAETEPAAGALVGWKKVLLIIFIGAFLGSIVSIFQIVVQKKSKKSLIPFGPFLSVATLITLFYGNLLIKLYIENLAQ